MKAWMISAGWIALGLLVLAASLLSAGRVENRSNPTVDSYYPSGASALMSLLRDRGYDVRINRSPQPKIAPGEIAVAFTIPGEMRETARTLKFLAQSAKDGAVVYWLPLLADFQAGTTGAWNPVEGTRTDGKGRTINSGNVNDYTALLTSDLSSGSDTDTDSSDSGTPTPPNAEPAETAILYKANSPLVSASKSGKGWEIRYTDGIGLTNRFIDKADNAQLFLETLSAVAPGKRRVVFTEAAFGNEQSEGLLHTIGAWAEASWFQILFLLAVIIFTLNRRFGLPEQTRPPQRGARELLDAVTDTYTRSKASGAALEAAATAAEARLRSTLRLPKDISPGERNRLLPESLGLAIARVKAAAGIERTPPNQALALIVSLERELDDFLQTTRQDRRGARRRPSAAA